MIEEIFLTTDEVLEYLHVNLRTVYLTKPFKVPNVLAVAARALGE